MANARYRVTMERVGRTRVPKPVMFEVKPDDAWKAGDVVAEGVYRWAGRMLASREYIVSVDLEAGTVHLDDGRFGTGKVELIEE